MRKHAFDRNQIAYARTSFFRSSSYFTRAVFKRLIASCCMLGRTCAYTSNVMLMLLWPSNSWTCIGYLVHPLRNRIFPQWDPLPFRAEVKYEVTLSISESIVGVDGSRSRLTAWCGLEYERAFPYLLRAVCDKSHAVASSASKLQAERRSWVVVGLDTSRSGASHLLNIDVKNARRVEIGKCLRPLAPAPWRNELWPSHSTRWIC
jgi:hypothetical protein